MKQFLYVLGILTLCLRINAQSKANGLERFYNIDAYKANITLTFQYQLTRSEPEYSKSVNVSQTFQHFFTTAPGQITAGDMFQIERGDKEEGENGNNDSQDGGILEGLDMDAVSQAMKNSGIDPSVMDELKKTKRETGSYNMGLGKYKMWMFNGVTGGEVSSSIYSKYSEEESGTIHCGEGQGFGSFNYDKSYSGSAHNDSGKSDNNNPNGFILQLNLANNSYSFTADVDMLRGFNFTGNDHTTQCSITENKPISINARSFLSISTEKDGLVYRHPLPEDGMELSGSKIITDRFNLWESLDKEGSWSVRIDWSINPTNN